MVFLEVILGLLALYIFFWLASAMVSVLFGSPTVYADTSAIEASLSLAKLKRGEMLVDLGCGDASSLILAAKKFGAKGIGVEISPYCFVSAKIKVYLAGERKNIKIIFGRFQKAQRYLKKADVVYLYLFPEMLKKIESWLFGGLKSGSRIVSLAFPFAIHQPSRTKNVVLNKRKIALRLYSN